ncbi:MAG: DUF4124 domain-containing protein [Methylotenera sp.]
MKQLFETQIQPNENGANLHRLNKPFSLAALSWLFASALLLTTFVQPANAEGKIVKWKDANGVTHYGDKLPAEAAGRSNSEINKTGVVVKNNNAYDAKVDSGEVERTNTSQARRDSALLASYGSIEEIDLARDRNIKSDELALANLNQRLTDTRATLQKTKDKQASYVKRKRPVPSNLTDDIRYNQAQIAKTQSEMTAVEKNIAVTMARFASYKVRYAELKPNNDKSPAIIEGKKTLVELDAKKVLVKARLNGFLKQALDAKKAGVEQPKEVSLGIQQANDELARLDLEIMATQAKMKE